MNLSPMLLITFSAFFIPCLEASGQKGIVRAVVESCPGCQLNRLTDVKKFVYDDLLKYEETEFKKIQGAPPVLIFYDENDQEVERHPLKEKSRHECNDLLINNGFKLKKPLKETKEL